MRYTWIHGILWVLLHGRLSLIHFCYLLKDNIDNGKKIGLFAMYHENGVRIFRGEYFDGVGIGKWVYYNEESVIIRKKDCDFE